MPKKNDNRKSHTSNGDEVWLFLLLVISLGKFALCDFLGFGKNLIVNLPGGETIEDIDTAQQVKVFGEICNGIRVDLQSFVPCF